MTKEDFLQLNQILHSNNTVYLYKQQRLPIQVNTLGMRYVIIDGIKYIEQNPYPKTPTEYSAAKQKGSKITWGIRNGGSWDLVVDNQVIRFNSIK